MDFSFAVFRSLTAEIDMWGECKEEDMQQGWSCNQMEQCLKALGHGGVPKEPLHIIDCGGSCSLDTTLRTGVWESLHNLFSPAGSRESHTLIYNWTQHIDQSLNMSVSAVETTLETFSSWTRTPFFILSAFPPLLEWPTVHPEGQEQSPVMWWQVPPFWQGQRCSQWGPWLPEGQRSPQLSPHTSQRVKISDT